MISRKYAEVFKSAGGEIRAGAQVLAIKNSGGRFQCETRSGVFESKFLINCAGLYSDRIARLAGANSELTIIPFRGEYYELALERGALVRALIYPVPDSRFPFLGVHFTRRINGEIEAGPNAVLALRREGYMKSDCDRQELMETLSYSGFWKMAARHWVIGLHEVWRSVNKRSFASALQCLVPALRASDLKPAGTGVTAQAMDVNGRLLDDFHFVHSKRAPPRL